MAVTRHEARGNAREPDGGTPGRRDALSGVSLYTQKDFRPALRSEMHKIKLSYSD